MAYTCILTAIGAAILGATSPPALLVTSKFYDIPNGSLILTGSSVVCLAIGYCFFLREPSVFRKTKIGRRASFWVNLFAGSLMIFGGAALLSTGTISVCRFFFPITKEIFDYGVHYTEENRNLIKF